MPCIFVYISDGLVSYIISKKGEQSYQALRKHIMAATKRILNIIPANDGVMSAYKGENNKVEVFPVICWALVEMTDGTTSVIGMDLSGDEEDKSLSLCSEDIDFIGYMTKDEVDSVDR